jgi:hypothetical protein
MNVADPTMLDTVELISVQVSPDRKSLRLKLRDGNGRTVALSLPANCLNTILNALPRELEIGPVHQLDSWSLARIDDGGDLVLTLRTPEGLAISFATKPWQLQGMATIAHYGTSGPGPEDTIH